MIAELCTRLAIPAVSRRIPIDLQAPVLRRLGKQIADTASIRRLPPLVACAMCMLVLRAAAIPVRHCVLAEPYTGAAPELLALTSAARAIAKRDCKLANALRLASPTARRHPRGELNTVRLDFAAEFSEHIRIAKAN